MKPDGRERETAHARKIVLNQQVDTDDERGQSGHNEQQIPRQDGRRWSDSLLFQHLPILGATSPGIDDEEVAVRQLTDHLEAMPFYSTGCGYVEGVPTLAELLGGRDPARLGRSAFVHQPIVPHRGVAVLDPDADMGRRVFVPDLHCAQLWMFMLGYDQSMVFIQCPSCHARFFWDSQFGAWGRPDGLTHVDWPAA